MSHGLHIARNVFALLLLAGIFIWLMIRALKKSEDPARLIFKWVLTVVALLYMIFFVLPMVAKGGYGAAFGGIPAAAVGGLFLAIIWRDSIASMIASPFGSIYDGGGQPLEPKPLYSAAQAHRKRGRYPEAIAAVRAQLAKFPDDFQGQMLLAEIQAENMNDLPGAEITIQRLCQQPGVTPHSLACALNALADWHLKYNQDREAARQDLEKIVALLPNSELSAAASQRLGHLAGTEQLLSSYDRRKIVITPGVEDIGLLPADQQPKAPEVDLGKQAADYVRHLQAHPLDTEARENLAILYADHFNRLDLAADQLEQLIAAPNQPAKYVAHWLNLLADLQSRHAGNYDTVRATLQRVLDLFPQSAAADLAANRIAHLRLELKGKEKSQAVQLGSYEQDVGLKHGSPHQL